MRQIILSFCCLLACSCIKLEASAQTLSFRRDTIKPAQTLNDLKEKMKTKGISVDIPSRGKTMTAGEKEMDNLSMLVDAVIASELRLVSVAYVVQKTNGKTILRQGKGYYDRAYGLGVVAGGKVVVHRYVAKPWEVDTTIPDLDDGKAEGEGRGIKIAPLDDLYQLEKIDKPKKTNEYIFISKVHKGTDGGIRVSSGSTSGYIVVVYTNDDIDERMDIKKRIIPFTPTWKDGKADFDPSVKGQIIGAAFFEQTTNRGFVQFSLAGLYHPDPKAMQPQLCRIIEAGSGNNK